MSRLMRLLKQQQHRKKVIQQQQKLAFMQYYRVTSIEKTAVSAVYIIMKYKIMFCCQLKTRQKYIPCEWVDIKLAIIRFQSMKKHQI